MNTCKLYGLVVAMVLLLTACGTKEDNEISVGVAEGRLVRVPALTGGKLAERLIEEGDTVSAGQVLAVIDTLAYHYQEQELLAALRENEVRTQLQQDAVGQAKTDLAYIGQKEARIRSLAENQSLPTQTLDDIANQRSKAATALETAIRQLGVLGAGRAQLQAKHATLRKTIRDAVIVAPIPGQASQLLYEPGEAVPPMQPVIEITDLSIMEADIYLSAALIPTIHTGDKVRVSVEGVTEPLTGEISWISPRAEFTPNQVLTEETRSSLVYAVKVKIPNPRGIIKHGMPVEIRRG